MVEYVRGWCVDGEVCVCGWSVCVWMKCVCGGVCMDGVCGWCVWMVCVKKEDGGSLRVHE